MKISNVKLDKGHTTTANLCSNVRLLLGFLDFNICAPLTLRKYYIFILLLLCLVML